MVNQKNIIFCCIIFLVVLGVYLATASPTVTSDDSGEFAGVTATLGIAHPSGYPVYSIFGRIIHLLIPFANHAFRTNFIGSFFGALAVSLLPFVLFSLLGTASLLLYTAAGVTSLLLAFSQHFWTMGIVTEVYTINAFFAVILILIANLSSLNTKLRFYLLSFVLGIGLGNHHTLILLSPALVWWAWINRKEISFSPVTAANVIMFFLIGLSVYLFIPIRASRNPLFNWEDPKTLERFIGLIKRARYGGNLMQGNPLPLTLSYVINQFGLYCVVLYKGMLIPGILFILSGCVFAFMHDFKKSITLLIMVLLTGPFFFILTRVPIGQNTIDLLERFMYLSYVPLCILAGTGAVFLFSKYFKNAGLFLILLLAVPVYLLARNFNGMNRRGDFVYYDYSKNILKTLPYNTILFSDRADETDFVIAYLTRIENYRNDIDYTECNAGVSRSIYGDNYYYIWGKPRLEIREKTERVIINSTDKEVYYSTVLPGQINIPKKKLGLVFRVEREKQNPRYTKYINWDEIYALRFPLKQDLRSNEMYSSYFDVLANYYLESGKLRKVEQFYRMLAELTHNKGRLLGIPWIYFGKGDLGTAEKKYKELLKLDPLWPEALVNLGVVYEKINKVDEARNNYLKAVQIDPQYSQAYYNLAVLYWRENNFKKVVEYFNKVLEIEPNNTDARKYLAVAMERQKQ